GESAPWGLVAGDQFGWSVSISSDGTTAAIGAESKNSTGGPNLHDVVGAVYVFTRSGSTWTQQAKLLPSDFPGSGLRFGTSVSLSADGNSLLIGARGNAWSGGPAP